MYYPRNVDLKEMPLPWRHDGNRQVDYRGITRQLKRLYTGADKIQRVPGEETLPVWGMIIR